MKLQHSTQRIGLAMFALMSIGLAGCHNGSEVTPAEVEKFKNPPKEMPKEAVEMMRNHGNGQPPAAAQQK